MGYMIDTGCQAVRLIITVGQIIAWCEGDTGVWALTMILYNEADATDHWKIIYVNIKIIGCLRIKNHDIDWKHGRHLMGLQSSSVIFLTMFKTFAVGWIFFSSGELNAIRAKLNFIIAYMWASPLRSKFSIPIWFPYSLWHKDKNCKTRKNDSEQSDCKRQISKKRCRRKRT